MISVESLARLIEALRANGEYAKVTAKIEPPHVAHVTVELSLKETAQVEEVRRLISS